MFAMNVSFFVCVRNNGVYILTSSLISFGLIVSLIFSLSFHLLKPGSICDEFFPLSMASVKKLAKLQISSRFQHFYAVRLSYFLGPEDSMRFHQINSSHC